jgi:hypothetical protein
LIAPPVTKIIKPTKKGKEKADGATGKDCCLQ